MKILNAKLARQYLKHLGEDVQRYDVWLRSVFCAIAEGPRLHESTELALSHSYDFGHWFYGEEGVTLRYLDAYPKVAKHYHGLQELTEDMRRQLHAGQKIGTEDLCIFVDQANVFRKYIYRLETEVREYLCALDPLTGVFTRQNMMARLLDEHQRILRNDHRCAILLMDIDHFKLINDRYGHNIGDQVLRESAEIVSDSLREYDAIYRFGGEEFLICLPYLDAKRARIAADRLRCQLKGQSIRVGRNKLQLTASFGASQLHSTCSPEDSITFADKALYFAKQGGRDRVEIWEGHPHSA